MRPRGGIIGANVNPTQTTASGIWTAREVEAYIRARVWAALPSAPTSVSGTAGGGQVSLTWTAPTTLGGYAITTYSIQYSSDSGSTWNTFALSASTATSGSVTGLTNGTAYVFRVATVTTLGMGAYSTASSSVTPVSFNPMAVILTSGTSYTVPSGASAMKAWAVGQGARGYYRTNTGAGGCAYKTWTVIGGSSVAYSIGNFTIYGTVLEPGRVGNDTTVTYGGVKITGGGGGLPTGGSYSGGDGGATGGGGTSSGTFHYGGAVGGNGTRTACGRTPMTDVSGLKAAITLAGGKATEDCGATAAFGSGGYYDSKYYGRIGNSYGAGNGDMSFDDIFSGGAVVLYFT